MFTTTPGSGNFPSTDTSKKIAEITVKTEDKKIAETTETIAEETTEEMTPENAETTEEMIPENVAETIEEMTPENAIMKDVNTTATDVLSTKLTTPMLIVAPVAAKDQTTVKEETKTTTEETKNKEDLAVPVAHLLDEKQNKDEKQKEEKSLWMK